MDDSATPTQTKKRAAHLGPERRRPQVLDAALKLFLKGGYDGTSMDAVAHAAGVTKPVVYACFSSKDDLFRSLLAREEELILAEVQGAFQDTDLSDPEPTLIEGFTGFLRAVDKRPEVYKLIFFGEGGGNAAVAERVAGRTPAAGRGAHRPGADLARGEGRRALANPDQRQRPADRLRARRARRVGRAPAALRSRTAGRPRRSAGSSAASRRARVSTPLTVHHRLTPD